MVLTGSQIASISLMRKYGREESRVPLGVAEEKETLGPIRKSPAEAPAWRCRCRLAQEMWQEARVSSERRQYVFSWGDSEEFLK